MRIPQVDVVRRVVSFALMTISATASGQASAVRGVIFDSVANAPLVGATVQIVKVAKGAHADDPQRTYTAITDSVGMFRVESIPKGAFGIGFQHSALQGLSLESPIRAFQIDHDTNLVIDLAIPSGHEVHRAICPSDAISMQALVVGIVRSATDAVSAGSAKVTLRWSELAITDKRLGLAQREVVQFVDEGMPFAACGIAATAPVSIAITKSGFFDIVGDIPIPPNGVFRRDWSLATTTIPAGRATAIGRLEHSDGSSVTSGRIIIGALGINSAVVNGKFILSEVPPGTWLLEARALGYVPTSTFVDVTANEMAPLTIRLAEKVQLLDGEIVTGRAGRQAKLLNEINQRARTNAGTLFLPGNSWLESMLSAEDVLPTARGFVGGGPRGCREQGSRGKHFETLLDGMPFPLGLAAITQLVPKRDILAIEVYPDAHSVPAQWRLANVCALAAVWTKQ